MAIYVTGDIHLNHDSAKLNSTFFPEGKNLTKNDYVIICGDCGFTWDWSSETRWWTNGTMKNRGRHYAWLEIKENICQKLIM